MRFAEKIYPDGRVLALLLFFFVLSQTVIFLKNVFPVLVEYHPHALLYKTDPQKPHKLYKKDGLRHFYDLKSGRVLPLPYLSLFPEDYEPLSEGKVIKELEGKRAELVPYREVFLKKLLKASSKNVKLLFFFLFSLALLSFFSNFNYRVFKEKKVVYALVLTSLLLLLVVVVKKYVTGAKAPVRWLFGTSIQPSEFSKIVIILFLAYYIGNKGYIESFSRYLWVVLVVLLHSFLLMAQPDLGMTIFVLLLAVSLLWAGGVAPRIFVPSLLIFGSVGGASLLLFSEHVQRRFQGWLDPFSDPYDKGYQIIKSLQALVKGGFFGEGLGKGLYAVTYIRESDTDYFISVFVENFGFVGFLLLLFTQLALAFRLLSYTRYIFGTYERLIILGVALNFLYSVFVNYAMAFNLLPPKGIALPFLSYGLSNLMANMIGLGIVGSIYRRYLAVLNL